MPLSSNTLIHFTTTKEALKQILQDNFHIFYCKETVVLKDGETVFYAPMVSFCDIPLSEIKDHISKYGSYGIGLTKEWGARKGLNPVLYLAQESKLAHSYEDAFSHFIGDVFIEEWTPQQKCLADVLRYVKNYEADLTRKGNVIKNYRFSDEREWRYVPCFSENCAMILSEEMYMSDTAAAKSSLASFRLEFEPNDIKYIIIEDDSEISEFVEHLKHVKGKTYTYHDVERLTTRILTTQQIKADI